MIEYLRQRTPVVPNGVLYLPTGARSAARDALNGSVFLHNINGQLCIVTALAVLGSGGDARASGPPPIVLSVRTVEQNLLRAIGGRLQLVNLRTVEHNEAPEGDHERRRCRSRRGLYRQPAARH